MAENFSFQSLILGSDVRGSTNLKLPVVSAPARIPGSAGLVGTTVQVRLLDQTILTLGGATPTWAQTVAQGNSSGGSIIVNGGLFMSTSQPVPTNPTNILTVSTTTAIPVGTSSPVGSLVFSTADGQLYVRTGGAWSAVATGAQTWGSSLLAGSSSNGTNPRISSTDQIVYDGGIRLGFTGTPAGAAPVNTIAIGGSATSTGSGSTSIGSSASSAGGSTAIGVNAVASGTSSYAFGTGAQATFANSAAIGTGAIAPAADVVQICSPTSDAVFGRYIATSITEGGKLRGLVGGAGIPADGNYHVIPGAYTTVDYNAVRPGSTYPGFLAYATANNNFVVVPNNARVVVNSFVLGGWTGLGGQVQGSGYLSSKLVLSDNGVQLVETETVGGIIGNAIAVTTSWMFSNTAVFKAGATGPQTIRVEIKMDNTITSDFLPVSAFIEVIRIS